MAPIKFEEQLKDKLEERRLSPSADSWAKLSERLDKDDNKGKFPWFWSMSIAAGLIIMVAVAVQFFNNNELENNTPVLVEDNIKEQAEEQEDLETFKSEVASEDIDEEEVELPIIEDPKPIIIQNKVSQKTKADTRLAEEQTTAVDQQEIKEEILIVLNPEEVKSAIASAVNQQKELGDEAINKEVDSLLKLAHKEITKNKYTKDTEVTVDASLLLEDVEEEMGQSFRSRVFEALKGSYETVKTAVAERNN
ncbi:MAG: hypothetical protein HRU50_13035 [Winogradskyella sp.]|uniref:hypothetical protein n=1 Tax=Winogradskyella sp. TaxID=1883156 RepID=UPI0025F8F609|nr:hypothetical protein [Winogradskyella sp.]NRB60849.1 hypothetical protein [Winogradskyella sp.]